MPTPVLMPALSPDLEEASLARWFVAEGACVQPGDVLAEVRHGRRSLEIEAGAEGRIARILVPAGAENVKVATPIALVEELAAAPPREAAAADAATVEAEAADAATVGPGSDLVRAADNDEDGPPPQLSGGSADVTPPAERQVLAALAAVAAGAAPQAAAGVASTAPLAQPMTDAATRAPVGADQTRESPTQEDGALRAALAQPPAGGPAAAAVATPAAAERMTYREALRAALAEEMRRDPDVFLIGEEVGEHQGAFRVSEGLLAEFGAKRVVDTPITEAGFTGLAVGAAMAGLKPVVEFMSWNFAIQALDHIVNSAAKTLYMSGGTMRVPIVLRGPNGPASRAGAQHSQCLASWLAHVPGLKVVAPSNAADAKGLFRSALRDGGPVVVLEHEALYDAADEVPTGDSWRVPIGRARIARAGADVTLVSYSRGVTLALEAASQLAKEGIDAEVVDLRSLRPLDIGAVAASVRKTHRLVVVEESWPVCSIGAEVCAAVASAAFDDLDAPPTRVSAADVPMPYAENLERIALPGVDRVLAAARSVLYV